MHVCAVMTAWGTDLARLLTQMFDALNMRLTEACDIFAFGEVRELCPNTRAYELQRCCMLHLNSKYLQNSAK